MASKGKSLPHYTNTRPPVCTYLGGVELMMTQLAKMSPATHTTQLTQVPDAMSVSYGSQLPSCCLKEIPISELSVHVCWVVLLAHVVCSMHYPTQNSSSAALLRAIERAIKTNI
eukprot:12173333-Ditylum_brightwellii.AAC.1